MMVERGVRAARRALPGWAVVGAEQGIGHLSRWLARHSIDVLRVSLGLVFLGFGALKLVPGASPAEDLAVATVEALTLGVVSGGTALLMTAGLECFIGVTLITGRLVRVGLVVLGVSLVGMVSPLVLFFSDMFPGAPTLEAQYILKDVVLAAAGLVIGARALGARLVPDTGVPRRPTGHATDGDGSSFPEMAADRAAPSVRS